MECRFNCRTIFLIAAIQVTSGIMRPAMAADNADSTTCGECLRIVQISDVQLGFTFARSRENALIQKNKPDSIDRGIDEAYFEKAVYCINHLFPKPDVVVNTGDLVNDPENQIQWHNYVRISDKIQAPLYEVMGNHDGWSPSGVLEFKSRFQRNDFYSFSIKGCLFVVLNSWYLKYPDQNPVEANKQYQFLTSTLKNNQSSKFKIILLHFPLFLNTPDEQEAYFNLPVEQRKWLLDEAVKNNVRIILTGHSHRNNLLSYKDSVSIITTGPVSEAMGINSDSTVSKRGFRVIDVNLKTGAFKHQFFPLAENKSDSYVHPVEMHSLR